LKQAELDAPNLYPIFLTLLRTGMRIGEVAGLFWEDIDFARGEINIRRQFSTERVWGTLKNDDERKVGLSPQLADVLRRHQARTFLRDAIEVEVAGRLQRGHLVFVNRRGGPITTDTIKKVRDELCRRAGVKRIRVHDFRHTVATMLRQLGVSCEDIAELFGHADSQMAQRYAHIVPEVQLRTVHLLDDAAYEREAVTMGAWSSGQSDLECSPSVVLRIIVV
jgi:integrase